MSFLTNEKYQSSSESSSSSQDVGTDGLPVQSEYESESEDKNIGLDQEEDQSEVKQTQSAPATVMNMLNSILGSGILSIANCFIPTGFITSLILLIVLAFLSLVATIMVLRLSSETNSIGFNELTLKISGKVGTIILSILNLCFLVLGLITYFIIATDSLVSWFQLGGIDLSDKYKRAVCTLIYSIIPIALTIPRNISFLRFCSTATVFLIAFYSVVMIYKMSAYVNEHHQINPTAHVALLRFEIFQSFSTYGISFALPAVVMPAIRLYKKKLSDRIKVAIAAVVVAFVFVMISGCCGYIIFGDSCNGNVLLNFENNDIIIIIVRAGFFVIVTCAYPMLGQSVMGSWGQLIFKEDNIPDMKTCKRSIVLLITNLIPLIVAMFLPDIKPVLAISGAFGGCLVDFVYPAVLWIIHHRSVYKTFDYRNILCVLFALFGLATAAISTYQSVISAIDAFK
ncbi:Transmembrane amino acid transporter protein [Histomonas meleagridis]|uniref:Transmembrane amino acid transporter protein n=1 Tax=Histomonas meleagridis TaxID=135588 RepID=UPI00355A3E2D|nr:Transmembrane amino acid transporter protein [Histomonas meleagridis]KAH0802938.1 Transmembrane amino acid transporter protein [Histomonas meleagridis]